MSEQRDPDFERYLAEHADLLRAYRAGSGESPPESLNAQIRAAARRAARSRPRLAGRRFPGAPSLPLATAAVVLLSASLLLIMREQGYTGLGRDLSKEAVSPTRSAEPAPAIPPADAGSPGRQAKDTFSAEQIEPITAPAPPAASPLPQELPAPATRTPGSTTVSMPPAVEADTGKGEAAAAAERQSSNAAPETPATPALNDLSRLVPEGAGVSTAPSSPPSVEQLRAPQAFPAKIGRDDVEGLPRSSSSLQSGERKKNGETARDSTKADEAERAQMPSSGGVPAGNVEEPASAAAQSEAEAKTEISTHGAESAADPRTLRSPAQWLEDIRRLVRENQLEEARRELERFRKAYPGYLLPADMEYLSREP
ncbi:MAG: hypothetical protein ACT4NU_11855 [Chromatiales bacterium]